MKLFLDLQGVEERPARYGALLRAVGQKAPTSRIVEWTQLLGYVAKEFSTVGRVIVRRREPKPPGHRARYLVRPWSSTLGPGPHAGQWLAFVCDYHESTRALVVVDREAVATAPLDPQERVVTGEFVYAKLRYAPSYCDAEASSLLKTMPLPQRTEAGDAVWGRWRDYLSWRRKVAEAKAAESYAYRDCDDRDVRCVRFLLRDAPPLEVLRRRLHEEELRVGEDPKDLRAPQGLFRRARQQPDGALLIEVDFSAAGASLPRLPAMGRLRVAMEGELATLDVQREGLRRLEEGQGGLPGLGEWLLHPERVPPLVAPAQPSVWEAERPLNQEQRAVVQRALDFSSMLLVWGPPGTGKTTVIAEICTQYARRGERVLVASQANLAVEQALARLPARPDVRPVWVSTARRREGTAGEVARFYIAWLKTVQTAVQADLLGGGAAETVREQRWQALRTFWTGLLAELTPDTFAGEDEAFYLQQANVVGATCHEAGKADFVASPRFSARFDLVVIDEVSKATPPELLPPLLLGRRVMLVGDHRQLPPLFRDEHFEDAIDNQELDRADVDRFKDLVTASWFERAFEQVPASARAGLLRQYRMHPQIMAAVNLFYADQPLEAGDDYVEQAKARRHALLVPEGADRPWLRPNLPLVWMDASRDRQGHRAREERIGTSRRNALEADLIVHGLREVLAHPAAAGLSVAVISFYKAQVALLRERLRAAQLKTQTFDAYRDVNTVDAFQGSERDIVFVSLVRAEERLTGEFARDFRRINVAFSRAKRLLLVVGNGQVFGPARVEVPAPKAATRESQPIYQQVADLARRQGGWVAGADLLSREGGVR